MRNVLIILSIVFSGPAHADDARGHQRERLEHVMGEDRIVAGQRALFSGAVGGDLVIAGGEAVVVEPVGGDLLAAGGEVRIDAEVGQDVYAAGGARVALNADVKRNARLAGGKVEIGHRASIAGNATVAGGDVMVLGDVLGQLAVAGGRIYLNGRVAGNVDASGGEIELGPAARIGGNTLLSAIPVLGWLVWLAALLGGMGMLLLQLRASTRASPGQFANRSTQNT